MKIATSATKSGRNLTLRGHEEISDQLQSSSRNETGSFVDTALGALDLASNFGKSREAPRLSERGGYLDRGGIVWMFGVEAERRVRSDANKRKIVSEAISTDFDETKIKDTRCQTICGK